MGQDGRVYLGLRSVRIGYGKAAISQRMGRPEGDDQRRDHFDGLDDFDEGRMLGTDGDGYC